MLLESIKEVAVANQTYSMSGPHLKDNEASLVCQKKQRWLYQNIEPRLKRHEYPFANLETDAISMVRRHADLS